MRSSAASSSRPRSPGRGTGGRPIATEPVSIDPTLTRVRILDATGALLARRGPRKLSFTDIATEAGVSRPTLYKYFASKDALLLALATHEKERFGTQLAVALHGLTGVARLDRALQFMVEFQRDYPTHGLVETEPGFMLGQLDGALRTMRASLVPLFEDVGPERGAVGARPVDVADLVVRTALSHFLFPGDDAQLLRELRHVAGIPMPRHAAPATRAATLTPARTNERS